MEKNREGSAPQEFKRNQKAAATSRADELGYQQEMEAAQGPTAKKMDDHPAVVAAKRRALEREAQTSVENARTLLDRMTDDDVAFFHDAAMSDQSGRLKELKKALGAARSEKLSSPQEGVKFLERFIGRMTQGKDVAAAEDAATLRARLEKALGSMPPVHRESAMKALNEYANRRSSGNRTGKN
jgi:hypothetical protein